MTAFAGVGGCSSSSSDSANACAAPIAGDYIVDMQGGSGDCPNECPAAFSVLVHVDSASQCSVVGAPVVDDCLTGDFGPFNPANSNCTSTMSCCTDTTSGCTAGTQVINIVCTQPDPKLSGDTDDERFRFELDAQGNLVAGNGSATGAVGSVATYSADEGMNRTVFCGWSLSGKRSH